MPAQSNIDMLEKVKGSIETSKGVFVVDYRGLTVKEAQELRRALREANAHMKVYKNNIVRIALNEAEMPNIDDMLKGTCAYVFYEKDPVEAAKVLKQEADKLKKMQIRRWHRRRQGHFGRGGLSHTPSSRPATSCSPSSCTSLAARSPALRRCALVPPGPRHRARRSPTSRPPSALLHYTHYRHYQKNLRAHEVPQRKEN